MDYRTDEQRNNSQKKGETTNKEKQDHVTKLKEKQKLKNKTQKINKYLLVKLFVRHKSEEE